MHIPCQFHPINIIQNNACQMWELILVKLSKTTLRNEINDNQHKVPVLNIQSICTKIFLQNVHIFGSSVQNTVTTTLQLYKRNSQCSISFTHCKIHRKSNLSDYTSTNYACKCKSSINNTHLWCLQHGNILPQAKSTYKALNTKSVRYV